MKYAFIKSQQRQHALTRLCSILNVSTSGYYDWLDRPSSATQRSNKSLLTKIRYFHQSSRQTYGSPRIHKDLIASGENVCINRVVKRSGSGLAIPHCWWPLIERRSKK